jgi:hypothetical protein
MSAILKHGGSRFMKTGILPKGKLHIARLIDGIISELIFDLGGDAEITASQKIIVSAIRQNLIFLALINEWLATQPNIIDKAGQVLGPLSGFYLACQNTVTRNCRELGLRRVNPADDLQGYLTRTYGKDKPAQGIGLGIESGKTLTPKTAKKRSSPTSQPGEVNE